MIQFTVYGNIVSQQRANFTSKTGKSFAYTPAKTKHWKERIQAEAIKVKPEIPIEVPLKMTLIFWFLIPKSKIKKDKKRQPIWASCSKDLDNLEKSIMDACQKILYRNDNQICWNDSRKQYTEGTERIEVTFNQL